MKWDVYYLVRPRELLLEAAVGWSEDERDALCSDLMLKDLEGDSRVWSRQD